MRGESQDFDVATTGLNGHTDKAIETPAPIEGTDP